MVYYRYKKERLNEKFNSAHEFLRKYISIVKKQLQEIFAAAFFMYRRK